MDEEYQTFRAAPDGPLIRIEVINDEESGQRVVFWEDIEFHFPGIRCIMNGDIAISPARDAKRKRIEPLCIKHHPGVVLDVILVNNNNSDSANSSGQYPVFQHSPNNSVNSLTINSPYTDNSGDNVLSRSFNNLSINTCVPGRDDPWQRQYDIPLTRTDNDTLLSPSGVSRTQSSVSRASSISKRPITNTLPICNSPVTASPNSLGPKIQSTLQTSAQLFGHFEQSIKMGQLNQAESIKQEIRTAFTNLQTEVARNQELQIQMLELQHTASEMQQKMLQMQQQALDRLSTIQSRVQAVLTQTYELHEYPIPRLFIVLPKETLRRDMVMNPFTNRFRLFFLCECGEHTKQQPSLQYPPPSPSQQQHYPHRRSERSTGSQDHHSALSNTSWNTGDSSWTGSTASVDSSLSSHDGSGSRMISHHIHLAKHEGYELDRPNEFFQRYGGHILALLQMLKYGVMVAGIVVPPLAHLRLNEGIEKVQNGLGSVESSLEPKVDYAIQYLEDLTSSFNIGNAVPSDQDRAMDNSREVAHELEALEGADLRQLGTFLKVKDEGKVLGNLYRIVTNEGHVKWVCLDHYRENYKDSAVKQFRDAVAVNNGTFEEATGKVSVRLSSSVVARQFYESLERAKFIQELSLVIDWETTLDDLRTLQDTIRKTNVAILKLDFCSTQSPSWDLFNRSRRYDPILQIMGDAKLQALYLTRCDGFWNRLTKTAASATKTMPFTSVLRILSVQGAIENWKVEQQRMGEFLKQCSRLTDLRLQCSDVDTTFQLVKNATGGFQVLQNLELTASELSGQEQVSITFAQPQAEMSAVTITTNKKPYTRLIHSGCVRKLVFYNQFSLATERATLEKVLQQNQDLHELAMRCSVHEVVQIFDFIWARAAYSKSLRLVEIQDLEGFNKVFSIDLKSPRATLLELISPDPTGREEIFRAFGWALKKIPPRMQFTTGLLRGLEEALRTRGSILQSLHVDISMLDEEALDLLAKVIQYSQPTLTKLNVILHASQANHRELAMAPLARFIVRASPQITRLQMHMYGLSLFLFALASAATEVQSASTSLSRTFTITGKGRTGDVTFPVASTPTLLDVVTMPNLWGLDIQPEADTYGNMIHCQINPPHIQWFQIPLMSPGLKSIRFGYLDFLKDDWTVIIQSIRFDIVEKLIFQGTNLSDGQVRQLLECLTKKKNDVGLLKSTTTSVIY
ncbi:hypothetical protein BGZ49_009111 [Haplosporangium sp. Z 27]|nr:hypothetical protein BGZ49_009111 [Haplosporangium sp. Z 27]